MNGRLAAGADVPVLLDMMRDFFALERIAFDAEKLSTALRTLLGTPLLGTVWLFEVDGAVVGYAIVTFGFDLEFGGRDAIVTDLYLQTSARGRGLGKMAIAEIERGAKDAGVHALHLLVDPSNERASRLYRGARFEPSHRVFMTKRLD